MAHLYVDGEKLLASRKLAELTQQQLATQADLSTARLRVLEQGRCNAHLDTVARLATILEIDPRDLLGVVEGGLSG